MAVTLPLVVVLGPTASGKTALGIHLARELNGEILACDSAQVYRHFHVGTGKASADERAAAPHHLLDYLEPSEETTAGDYARRAREALEEVSRRGRLPVVTAGTGLYLRAMLEGLSPLPPRSEALRERLRTAAEEKGGEYLHRMLGRVDPVSAKAIAPGDAPKLIRALEICFQARKPRSEFFRAGRDPLEGYRLLKLGLMPERAALYERIEARIEKMLDTGWLEETRRLRERFPADAKPFGFLGYRQLSAHLDGGLSFKDAVKQTKHETRQYAKRQITWFRKEPGVEWLHGFGDDAELQTAALRRVREHIVE